MATIGNLRIIISGDASSVAPAIQSVERSLGSLAHTAETAGGKLKSVFTAVGGGVAGYLAVDKAAQAIHTMIEVFGEITSTNRLATSLGTTVDQFSLLHHAVEALGLNQEDFDTAFRKMAAVLGDATNGAQSATEAFARLGLSADELARGDMTDAFLKVADSISRIPTAAERAAAAVDIFGRGGVSILPMIAKGSGEITAQMIEAEIAGGKITADMVERAKEAKNAIREMNEAWEAVKRNLATQYSGPIASSANRIAEHFTELKSLRLSRDFYRIRDVFNPFAWANGGWSETTKQLVRMHQERNRLEQEMEERARGARFSGANGLDFRTQAQSDADAAREVEAAAKRIDEFNKKAGTAPGNDLVNFIRELTQSIEKLNNVSEARAKLQSLAEGTFDEADYSQAAAMVSKLEELEATKKRQQEVDEAVKKTTSPAEEYLKNVQLLQDALRSGKIDYPRYARGIDQLERTRDQQTGLTSLFQQAKGIWQQGLNPLEKAQMELADVDRLQKVGALSDRAAQRARARIAAEWERSQPVGAPLAEYGSREAYQAIARHQQGRPEDAQTRLLDQIKSNTDNLKTLADELARFNQKLEAIGVTDLGA